MLQIYVISTSPLSVMSLSIVKSLGIFELGNGYIFVETSICASVCAYMCVHTQKREYVYFFFFFSCLPTILNSTEIKSFPKSNSGV